MEYATTKALTALAMPLGIVLVLLIAAFVTSRRRSSNAAILLATLILWTASTPFLANRLTAYWEAGFPPVSPTEVQSADAIILLGGAVQVRTKDGAADLNAAADRLLVAHDLFIAGKSPVIIVVGGNEPFRSGWMSEAAVTKKLLEKFGIPAATIITEERSVNTAQNALFVQEILDKIGARRVLLVTSAFHMARARTLMAKNGLEIIPVPADYRADVREELWVGDFFPSADALALTSTVLKEVLGLGYGRIRTLTEAGT